MDGPKEMPHMGFIYVVMCPRRRWCGWRFNYGGFGRSEDATVLSRDLPMSTLGVGLSLRYLMVLLCLNLYVYVLNVYMYYEKRALVVSGVTLAW